MKPDLQRLVFEYSTIEKMDLLIRGAGCVEKWELIGLAARAIRRREILRDLKVWIDLEQSSLGADRSGKTNLKGCRGARHTIV